MRNLPDKTITELHNINARLAAQLTYHTPGSFAHTRIREAINYTQQEIDARTPPEHVHWTPTPHPRTPFTTTHPCGCTHTWWARTPLQPDTLPTLQQLRCPTHNEPTTTLGKPDEPPTQTPELRYAHTDDNITAQQPPLPTPPYNPGGYIPSGSSGTGGGAGGEPGSGHTHLPTTYPTPTPNPATPAYNAVTELREAFEQMTNSLRDINNATHPTPPPPPRHGPPHDPHRHRGKTK